MMTGSEAHRGWDHDGDGVGTRGSGLGAREDGDFLNDDWRKVLLTCPVLIVDIDSGTAECSRSPITQFRCREKYSEGAVAFFDGGRRKVVGSRENQIGIAADVDGRPAFTQTCP